jgi:hypothetical protein
MSTEAEKHVVAETERQAKEATDKFREAVATEGPLGVVKAFGEMVTGVSHAVGDFGDGLGEVLEESSQKAFHSEEFGSGFFQETGEAFMSVIGEATEGITEASAGVGEAVGVAVGGVIEGVGSVGEHLWEAGKDLVHGDIGDAAENVLGVVKDVGGLAETAVDFTVAGVSAVGELVEGAGAVAWEVGEGAVEMAVGGAKDLAHLAEDAWDAINPFD